MGRKSAPQPLALPDQQSLVQPRPGDSLSTTSPGVSPAVSTTSPISGSSITSRFAQKRPQASRNPQSPSSDRPNQQQLPQRRPSPTPSDSQKLANYSHIASAFNHSTPQGREATEPKKQSKGLFSHFNKSSRTNNSPAHAPSSSRTHIQVLRSEGPGTKEYSEPPEKDHSEDGSTTLQPAQSELSSSTAPTTAGEVDSTTAETSLTKRAKPGPFGLLTRTKSQRGDRNITPTVKVVHDPMPVNMSDNGSRSNTPPLRTAPVAQDRSFREMMDSSVRNQSEDRAPSRGNGIKEQKERRPSPSHRENAGTFFSGLKNSGTRAAGMLSKGLFGKGSRSGSTTDRESANMVDDEHYIPKVINLPLIDQTRKTRIAKRLEDARDKTEFWMPAFPWRAIDYLNYKGCEVEGLYRVPGSGPQIKKWQRRFDEEYDVDLFNQDDLYDINIVGSMLKAWLRELPDELFPKAAQERVSRECAGAEKVPQLLIDELSNLSPFQYYLLFAITCHLSLLLAHSDKNKMNFQNLCICFQPCMKIDAFCFKFLVCDWRDCWQGCKNENKYIEEEYILMHQPPPPSLIDSITTSSPEPGEAPRNEQQEQRPASPSSASSKPSHQHTHTHTRTESQPGRLNKKNLQVSGSNVSIGSKDSSISTTLSVDSDKEQDREHERERECEPPKAVAELRRLSPIKPLSPLGFQ